MKWLNKKKEKQNEEETTKMTTLEQIKKAYADLSEDDKKAFHQSLKDRVDESVGEQEHLDGDRATQTAKDRVDEAEGAEKADEEKKEEKHEERQDMRDEKHDDRIEDLFQKFDELSSKLEALVKKPQEADKSESDELDKITQKWD